MENGKGKKIELLDEGILLNPKPTKEMKEHMRNVRLLTNQHLLNVDKTDLKPSAVIKQSINDLQ